MRDKSLPFITIYTDGACNPNPGPGGWAAILLRPNGVTQELSGAADYTTNNQMELQAVIKALMSLADGHLVTLYTDSKYLKKGITEWLPEWRQRGWLTKDKQPVKNQALWEALETQVQRHHIEWEWVKGHVGNKWNERADELARAMLPKVEFPLDDETAIHIFAAASYLGKQKSGGWGVVMRYQEHIKTLNGHEANTSANRMHLLAAINGLQALKRPLPVHFYTGSDYVRDGITKWVKAWQRQNWQTKTGKPVSHRDLWEILLALSSQYQIRWHLATKQHQPEALIEAKNLSDAAARR